MVQHKMARKILCPRRGNNRMGKKMANEELYDLYNSSNIIPLIKSRRTRWPGASGREEGGGETYSK